MCTHHPHVTMFLERSHDGPRQAMCQQSDMPTDPTYPYAQMATVHGEPSPLHKAAGLLAGLVITLAPVAPGVFA
jgi:hypothetical protein